MKRADCRIKKHCHNAPGPIHAETTLCARNRFAIIILNFPYTIFVNHLNQHLFLNQHVRMNVVLEHSLLP